MAIDASGEPDLEYKFIERWDVNGHEVALMLLNGPNGCEERHLLCECDFPENPNKPIIWDGPGDPHSCPAKKHIRAKVMLQARERYGALWIKMTNKEIVLDIWKRVTNGEYLGESMIGFVYVQEVAELACMTEMAVRSVCDELFGEEKLQLNGAILCEFVPGFRFPLEMKNVISYVVEEPLGWPNGDAGMFAVAEIENEIENRTHCKSGKDAFGKYFPHIEKKILAPAFEWLASSLKAAAKNKRKRNRLHALSTDGITKDFKWFPQKYPEIRVGFYAEFIKALLEAVFKNMPLEASMNKKATEASILRYWANFFVRAAKNLKQT